MTKRQELSFLEGLCSANGTAGVWHIDSYGMAGSSTYHWAAGELPAGPHWRNLDTFCKIESNCKPVTSAGA